MFAVHIQVDKFKLTTSLGLIFKEETYVVHLPYLTGTGLYQ